MLYPLQRKLINKRLEDFKDEILKTKIQSIDDKFFATNSVSIPEFTHFKQYKSGMMKTFAQNKHERLVAQPDQGCISQDKSEIGKYDLLFVKIAFTVSKFANE